LAALLHGTLVVGVNQTAALNRGRHLYSAGRPSRWALAHILVLLFWATVCKMVRPILSDRCPVCPGCNVRVYCGQTIGRIKMKLGTEVGFRPGHTVLDGKPAPTKGHSSSSNFRFTSVVAKRLDGSRYYFVWR